MSIKPTSVAPKTLYQSITSASTSFKLNNILAWDNVTDLTSADFGSQAFGAFLSADRSRIEFFEWDPATIASASITILNRGLPFTGSVTPSASLKLDWTANDTTVLLGSDTPQFLMQMAFLASNNAFTGYNTVPDPLSATDIANKQWVLGIVNGGAVSFNQMIEAGIAGETVVAGNLLYFSETDNEWLKTDADTLATLFNVKLGIAMGAGTNGNAITGGVLTRGSYTTSGLTQGDLCYASNTAGGINSGTAGTNPRVIGIAKDSTTLYFDPDFQNTLYDYAVDSVGTDAYAVTMPGALSVPFVGMEINFKAGTANTGACTLNVNALGAKSIYKNVSTELSTGDILANQIIKVVYDGTNWQMISLTSNVISGVPVVRTYLYADSPATWTKPAGLKYIKVQVQAAGGAGAGANSNGVTGGGGAGGGYSEKIIQASDLGPTETITIGQGGVGDDNVGTDGGPSSFGSHLSATGGKAGTLNGLGAVAGVGTGGSLNIKGTGGAPRNSDQFSGNGGSSFLGGGAPGIYGEGDGVSGGQYGGGGSGAYRNSVTKNGGNGADGIVIVTEYYS